MTTLYLRKANDDLVSHCKCAQTDALISSPAQMDCPWCGCGWLFVCSRCRRAFTFAEAAEVDESWEEIGGRTLQLLYRREPAPGEIDEWIAFMKILLKGVTPGERYVYLDGYVIPSATTDFTIEGWHSNHELAVVPQVAAMKDARVRDEILCSEEYWQSRRVEA